MADTTIELSQKELAGIAFQERGGKLVVGATSDVDKEPGTDGDKRTLLNRFTGDTIAGVGKADTLLIKDKNNKDTTLLTMPGSSDALDTGQADKLLIGYQVHTLIQLDEAVKLSGDERSKALAALGFSDEEAKRLSEAQDAGNLNIVLPKHVAEQHDVAIGTTPVDQSVINESLGNPLLAGNPAAARAMISYHQHESAAEFQRIDTNHDKEVSGKELEALSPERYNNLKAMLDLGGNGNISLAEIGASMKAAGIQMADDTRDVLIKPDNTPAVEQPREHTPTR